ncbi:MAG: hypothetical protein DRN29_08195 [Thermoplasmata archaeon]|nr:MAG: hypothetical protein DRN29_08195 [Thermoplasmata archaeon]
MKVARKVGRQGCIALAVLLVALVPRLLSLDVFLTSDELKWTCRAICFRAALSSGDFAKTFQAGHPGVITMWAGTVGIPLEPSVEWLELCQDPRISTFLDKVSPEAMARLAGLLFAARVPIALITSATVLGIYLLVERLFGRRTALFSALLVALDPFYLAHSRLFHLDAVTTGFMTLSLLSLLIYLNRKASYLYLALSGAMAGLAFLNKSPALFMGPFAVFLVSFAMFRRKEGITNRLCGAIKTLAVWSAAAGIVYVALWPSMWVDPVGTVQKVLGVSIGYAEAPHVNLNFFWGEIRPDPGPWFYPVAWAFRTTPLVMLGLIPSALLLVKKERGQRTALAELLAFSALFAAFMTLGAKKFDRYILPIFPALDIVAAVGFNHLVEMINRRMNRINAYLVAVASIALLSAGLSLPYHPYYLPYYNPLLGGSGQAPNMLLVGWGEGLDKAAQYLNGKEDAAELRVALRNVSQFAPLFVGRTVAADDYDPATTDYVVIYLNQVQRNLSPELLDRYYRKREPEHTVNLYGIDYAWIYANVNYRAPMEYIAQHAEAGDVLLVSRPSLFAKHYDGDLPLHVMGRGWNEAKIAAELQKALEGRRRIWYVKYLEKYPNSTLELIEYQLATRLFKVKEKTFPDITLSLYRAFDSPSFEISAIQSPLDLNFEGKLRLRGYGLVDEVAQWGRDLGIVLQWEALQDLDRHYAAFIHLVDEQGHVWGQGDKWLMNESLISTAGWRVGEIVLDRYVLSLLKGTPPGQYRLRIGLYDPMGGGRLEIRDGKGVSLGDSYELGTITVKSSPLALSPQELEIRYPLARTLAGCRLSLQGYGVAMEKVAFGEEFTLTLYWQALKKMQEDYALLVQLRGDKGVWAEGSYVLGSRYYPTSQWREGEVLWNRYDLRVDAEAPWGEGILEINLLDAKGEPLLEKPLALTKMDIQGRRFVVPEISHPMKVDLGGKVDFLGYDLKTTKIKAGETIHLTLYWRAKREMRVSYTVFTHLLGEDNTIWGQKDGIPMKGRHPTTQWQVGEVIVDEYEIITKKDTPEGIYRLEVGMYDLNTGERLPAFEGGRRLEGDRILLDCEISVMADLQGSE